MTISEKGMVPAALIETAKKRSQEVIAKLRKAMATIELEIEQNDGLYPYNGGRITQAEVCRRAGVSKITLQGPAHKTSTKKLVNDWVVRVAAGAVTGKRSVRKTVTARADAWKEAHAAIANAYHLDKLKLIEAQRKIAELEAEVAALRELLTTSAAGKVIALKARQNKNTE